MRPGLRWLALPMLLLVCLAAREPAMRLVAEIYAGYAQQGLDRGDAGASVLQSLEFARRLFPRDPSYREQRAELDRLQRQWRAAETNYNGAMLLRPSWPYTPAALLQSYAAQGIFDRRFDAALRHSLALGPNERELHRMLASLGVYHWPRLSPQARALIARHSIPAALRYTRYPFIGFLQQTGRELFVCARFVGDDPELRSWCESRRKLHALCARAAQSARLDAWCRERNVMPPAGQGAGAP